MEISRWCQPPDNAKKKHTSPGRGGGMPLNYPPPLPGLFSCRYRFRWLTPPANLPQPSGSISPSLRLIPKLHYRYGAHSRRNGIEENAVGESAGLIAQKSAFPDGVRKRSNADIMMPKLPY